MRLKSITIIFTLMVALISCREGEYFPDPIDPRIIKYTDDGKDAAGALIKWKTLEVACKKFFILYRGRAYRTILFQPRQFSA
jgi:hypothetical protein